MGKFWVLDTETKGTGAQMVPLETAVDDSARRAPVMVRPQPPRTKAPAPRRPPSFRVVDVMTRQVLAEDADTRTTVDVLRDVERAIDVSISKWDEKGERWRMLTNRESRLLWGFRER